MRSTRNFIAATAVCFLLFIGNALGQNCGLLPAAQITLEGGGTTLPCGTTGWSRTIRVENPEWEVKYRLVKDGVAGGWRPNGDSQEPFGWSITEEGTYVVQGQREGCDYYEMDQWSFNRQTASGISATSSDPDNTVCQSEFIRLTASGGAGFSSYTWKAVSPTGQTLNLDYPHTGQASIEPEQSGTYWVEGANECGGPETSNPVNVTIIPMVTSIPNITANTGLCKGTSNEPFALLNMNLAAVHANYLTWSITGTGSGNSITPTGQTTATTAYASFGANFAGSATITVTAYGCGGSSASKSTAVLLSYPRAAYLQWEGTLSICDVSGSPSSPNSVKVRLYGDGQLEDIEYKIMRTTPGGQIQVARSFSGLDPATDQPRTYYEYNEDELGTYTAVANGLGCTNIPMNGDFTISRTQPASLNVDVSGGNPSGACQGTQILLKPTGITNAHWIMRAPYGSNENDINAVSGPLPPGSPPGSFVPLETGSYYVKGQDSNCGLNLQSEDIPINFLSVSAPTAEAWGAFVGNATELRVQNPSSQYVYRFYDEGGAPLTNEGSNEYVLKKTVAQNTVTKVYVTATKISCTSSPSPLYSLICYPNPVIVEDDGPVEGIFPTTIKTTQPYSSYVWNKLSDPGPGSFVVGRATTYYVSTPGGYFLDVTIPYTIGTGRSEIAFYGQIRDDAMNWVETKQFDEGVALVGNTRDYFDWIGAHAQTQTRNITESGTILATQGLVDRFGRNVGVALPAPIAETAFKYKYLFLRNGSRPYDFHDFDNPNPAPIAAPQRGEAGWYYSTSNDFETNVPTTGYPYSRIDFYNDGSGEQKRSSGPGEIHRMGAGHESLTGTFPVYHELDDFLSRRAAVTGATAEVSSLFRAGLQTVVRDENQRYLLTIADRDGRNVMTAHKGTPGDPNTLEVTNHVLFNATSHHQILYFYLMDAQPLTIGGTGQFVLRDLVNDTQLAIQSGATYPAGFYKFDLEAGAIVDLTFKNYLTDIAYNFYDNAGRLRTSVTPNGFNQLRSSIPYSKVDHTEKLYNHRGMLTQISEPDAGITRFKYRKDGKIRFSQNAHQLAQNTFSYTHYDYLSRTVESGEYTGTTLFSNLTSNDLETICDPSVGCAWTSRKDWTMLHYDLPISQADLTRLEITLPGDLKQSFIAGIVSWTESATNATIYSYDEFGRVAWMCQRPKKLMVGKQGGGTQELNLNRSFILKYKYDFGGRVREVKSYAVNSAGNEIALSAFFHHYEYDADKRLSIVKTSLDGVHTAQRAKYIYYLHGPLKRVELGDKLQGIDFKYNINGWLIQINHPDNANDPGQDGVSNGFKEDVFGMTLDYYSSSMDLLLGSTSIYQRFDPGKYHRIPIDDEERSSEIASTESIIEGQLRLSLEQIKRYKAG